MPHDVAGGFGDRELELTHTVLLERRAGECPADFSNKGPRSRELVEIARNFQLCSCERQLSLLDLHRDTRQVVAECLRVGERDGRLANLIDQDFGFEPAVDPNTLGKSLYAKQVTSAIPRFCQPIGIEQQDVARMQCNADLVVNLPLADAQWQILSLQHGARSRARLEMNRRRVAAVYEIEPTFLEVEPGVADGHKTLELDELSSDL